MLAARVLSESHDVVVLERDKLSDEPEYRSGVPQGRHVHGLLVHGGEIMEGLFPGLYNELVQAGAHLIDASEVRILNPCGWLASTSGTGMRLLSVSRPLLETSIRRRVTAKIVDGVHVTGLSFRGAVVDGFSPVTGRSTRT